MDGLLLDFFYMFLENDISNLSYEEVIKEYAANLVKHWMKTPLDSLVPSNRSLTTEVLFWSLELGPNVCSPILLPPQSWTGYGEDSLFYILLWKEWLFIYFLKICFLLSYKGPMPTGWLFYPSFPRIPANHIFSILSNMDPEKMSILPLLQEET